MRCGIAEDEEPVGRARSSRARCRSTSPTRRSARGSSRASRTCSGSRRARPATRRTSSPPGGSSSSGSRSSRRPSSSSRTCSGRTRACSTSSSTCSSGRAAIPLFVLALARPEFADKRPTWGAGKRSFSSLYLEPLSPDAMDDLLTGLVPGLPDELRARILERAEGVPLYAVETVRMLLDRGLLAREGNVYRPTGSVETLEVPETLHALIAARLDALTARGAAARRGRCRARQDLHEAGPGRADRGYPRPSSSRCSRALLRKEVLSSRPTRARPSAASTPSCRTSSSGSPTRRSRSRSARRSTSRPREFLASPSGADEDEFVEVVAAHYLDALRGRPRRGRRRRDPRERARDARPRGGAGRLARRERGGAARLRAGDRADRRPLVAGRAARARGDDGRDRCARRTRRSAHFERAIALFEAADATPRGRPGLGPARRDRCGIAGGSSTASKA